MRHLNCFYCGFFGCFAKLNGSTLTLNATRQKVNEELKTFSKVCSKDHFVVVAELKSLLIKKEDNFQMRWSYQFWYWLAVTHFCWNFLMTEPRRRNCAGYSRLSPCAKTGERLNRRVKDIPLIFTLWLGHITGKNNRFPFLDILGYLKNNHKNPNLEEWDKS